MHFHSSCNHVPNFDIVLLNPQLLLVSLSAAFSCVSLRFIDKTPKVILPPGQSNYSLTFRFSHGNSAGKYECFVRVLEKCPLTRWEHSCDQMENVTFTNLHAGAWFSCGVRCTLGGIQRTITRSFPTPAAPQDCCPYLVDDGVTFTNYTNASEATTCFTWHSTGSPTGFQCRVDAEEFQSCKCVCVTNYNMSLCSLASKG